MAQAASEAQKNAPDNPLQPATATMPSSYTVASDTVSWPGVFISLPLIPMYQGGLVDTFLGIAESLMTPRLP
jgi:hypothetical protein